MGNWKRKDVELVFPSGNTAVVRPINGDFVLRHPNLPDTLTPIVLNILNGTGGIAPPEDRQAVLDLYAFADDVLKHAFVSPRIVDVAVAEDEITLDDIDDEDRFYILVLIGKGARTLESFRSQQGGNVARVGHAAGAKTTGE